MRHLVVVVLVVVVTASIAETLAEDPVCVDSQNGQCGFVASSPSEPAEFSAVFYSLMGSVAVGLTGIIPLVLIPHEGEKQDDSPFMNRALSFAAGALLGDVFLHILPECLQTAGGDAQDIHQHTVYNGVLILVGIISFFMLEKILSATENDEERCLENAANRNGNNNVDQEPEPTEKNEHAVGQAPIANYLNGAVLGGRERNDPAAGEGQGQLQKSGKQVVQGEARAAGYLNLFANCLDNFTHGLAIGGSFLVSYKFGLMTTAAILLHEIPHEFGDFAILLRAGFPRWTAAKWQIITATGGLFGAFFAHIIDPRSVWWILPFTAGGFLHIALCTIIPDLMKAKCSILESIFQLSILIFGVCVMGWIGVLE